jgi:hypothetical protein
VEWDAEEADRRAMEEEQDRANEEYAADMAAMEQAEEDAQQAKEELIDEAVQYMISLDRSPHPDQEEHLEEEIHREQQVRPDSSQRACAREAAGCRRTPSPMHKNYQPRDADAHCLPSSSSSKR